MHKYKWSNKLEERGGGRGERGNRRILNVSNNFVSNEFFDSDGGRKETSLHGLQSRLDSLILRNLQSPKIINQQRDKREEKRKER